ncbi:MAG: hypothetical protein M3063_04180 [Actinomycetota bacterium]|nr:hypothetical protein [Actinomycetota bacterium]
MTWARILDGAVVETAPAPPSSMANEDGSVTLGVRTDDVTALAAMGWYPVTDDGPSWDSGTQSWDGAPPTYDVTPGGVTATYAITDRSLDELRAGALAQVDATEAAALADLRAAAIDALIAGNLDSPAHVAAVDAAHSDAEAKRTGIAKRKRSDFAGTVVSRPPIA